ncbi:MAG: glycosyltransferase [Acutalibacteraceae bacterium]
MTKISVIVPVYNVEKYLKKCIQSILAQDFSEYEIILVDDGSTDESGKICDEYSLKYSQIKVIHQKNKGLGGARNRGIEEACGNYLLFIDSDDSIKENMLSYLYNTAIDNDSDLVLFGMDYIDEDGKLIETKRPSNSGIRNIDSDERADIFSVDPYTCNKLFKRDIFIKNNIRYPEQMWYEDLCVAPKIMLCADKVTVTDKVFYNYLQRKNSIMHVKDTDRNSDMLEVVSDILDFYREKGAFDKYYQQLCFMTVMHVMVLCTLRVATDDIHHPLLNSFYDFTFKNFPDFKKNSFVNEKLTLRHKIIFAFSKRKMYGMIKLLSQLNKFR